MFGIVYSACVHGIEGQLIEVEVDISNGLPQTAIVGLPDSAVRESMERVRAAIKNCGLTFPLARVTVNLAPADVRKEGASFDLAIAAGIMAASNQLSGMVTPLTLLIGELSLEGRLRPVPGVLSMVHGAKQKGFEQVIVAAENVQEARLIDGIRVVALSRLSDLAISRTGLDEEAASAAPPANTSLLAEEMPSEAGEDANAVDYADVSGQLHVKRALMIAAAGMHNLMMIGPPGTGKTMLARRLPTILPDMSDAEALEVTKLYSVAGKLSDRGSFIRKRPFRSPHHTVSAGGLIGGGSIPKPGEASLAHGGVLFLDELPEFTRTVLEVLRQPLEDRHVTIGRARAVYSFPSRFMLVASMNPCPCGYYGAETASSACSCSPLKIGAYRSRISGPLLDRIDLHIDVPRIDYGTIVSRTPPLSSAEMKAAVLRVHGLQQKRYKSAGIHFNGELTGRLLRKHCAVRPDAEQLLKQTFDALGLSARAHDRILKIARTIADLDEHHDIGVPHIAEAIQYRQLDRQVHDTANR
ncbi:YifB family Mg chelatase-like AAA ATPase [Paenibacillus sp. MBLB4367]|uniref:YifB family Mg chelatase-like AAA ATPase n=1 Tax=Paenibacillus sp. MBLB4367 TaxID=3384767 RepID=UPI0039080EFC